jgi:hypothetical protein
MLGRLFADGPGAYPSLDELNRDLHETHAHPAEVTPAIRAAQLGIQAAVLAAGLVLLFGMVGTAAVELTRVADMRARNVELLLAALHGSDPRDVLGSANAKAAAAVRKSPVAVHRLEELLERKRKEAADRRAALLRPQRFLLEKVLPPEVEATDVGSDDAHDMLTWAVAPESGPPLKRSRAARSPSPWGMEAVGFWVVLAVIPLAWVAGAAVFRGGLSMVLTGVALVRSDGRRATRRQCALRTAVVWLPVVALLSASLALQVYAWDRAYTYTALWLIALGLLPVYVMIALWYPDRPPQDRLVGTTLVPA